MKKRANKVVGSDGGLYPEGTTFSDVPLRPEEIASDANLSLAALQNQLRAEQDEADEYTMTGAKLAEKLKTRPPGFGHATLHLPDGLAQSYDLRKLSEEDAELVLEEQRKHKESS